MMPLTALRIQITTFDEYNSTPNYESFTLPCTPFYIKPIWVDMSQYYSFGQNNIVWDMGDGTQIVGPSAQYYYKIPGTYNITATVYNIDNDPFLVNLTTKNVPAQVTVYNAMPDCVFIENLLPADQLGVYLLPAGQRSRSINIRRYNSWQNDKELSKNNYSVMLYASGAKSNFLSVSSYYTDKWSHLKAFFGFCEQYTTQDGVITSKVIDSTKTSSVSVYAKKYKTIDSKVGLTFTTQPDESTSFVGTTGSTVDGLDIFYTDQKPSYRSDELTFIFANFDTKNFLSLDNNLINSNIKNLAPYGYINFTPAVTYLKSIFNPAQYLEITSNGISLEGQKTNTGSLSNQTLHSFSIYPYKYKNTDIPFTITFKDQEDYTTKCYPPITAIKTDGSVPTELNQASIGLYKFTTQDPNAQYVPVSTYRIDIADISQNPNSPNYIKSGSYFCGIVNSPIAVDSVALSAVALIKDTPTFNPGSIYGFAGQPGISSIKRFSKRPVYSYCETDTLEFTYKGNLQTYTTSSSAHTIVTIAPLASNGLTVPDKIWIADSDHDKIYVLSKEGELLTTFALSATPTYNGEFAAKIINYTGSLSAATPSNIAIDGSGNAWVTLYNAISCIKINTNTYVVDSVATPPMLNINLTDSTLYRTYSGFVGENLLLPTCIDTDKDNNIFVGYSHPVSGFIIKYDSTGAFKKLIAVETPLSVQEILVNRLNQVIAIFKNNNHTSDRFQSTDLLYKWDNDLNLIDGYPISVPDAGNLTIDLQQNIWLNSQFTNIFKIDFNDNLSSLKLVDTLPNTNYYQAIGGVACDAEGFLWVLHNYDGRIYYYPTSQVIELSSTYSEILPDIQLTLPGGGPAFYSVYGDWTGIRWVNKYSTIVNPLPRLVGGTSNLFNIVDYSPVINKVNENNDQSSVYKSYILQEGLFDNPQLWDNFIGQIVGTQTSSPECLGKVVYEKIANMVSNNSDPDVCNITSLKSLFNQYGLTFYDFVQEYPPELLRAVNLLSINQSKLIGSPNLYNENFGLSSLNYDYGKNLGTEIDIETGTFVVGKPIVAYEKFSEIYTKITNTIIPETNNIPVIVGNSYPLSCVNYNWGWGLITGNQSQSGIDIKPYYRFYNYVEYMPKDMVDGVIDFTNNLTTISPKASSYSEWTKYGGIMDRVISRALYRGLNIINE